MGKNMTITVRGGEALAAKLKRMGAEASAALELAAEAGMAAIESAAEPLAPGPHLESETTERKQNVARVEMGPDKEHWYYRFSEYGAGEHDVVGNPFLMFKGNAGTVVTRKVVHPGIKARPFLRPAFDGRRKKAQRNTGQVLRRVILRGSR